jgi:hypothetical protein
MSAASTRSRAAWDPKSYLADAASEHVLSVDAKAGATTIVNYYEFIAAQLEERGVSQYVLEQAALQSGTVFHDSAASLALGVGDASVASSTPSPPTSEQVCVVRGVAMCVPFKIIVVVQHTAEAGESVHVGSRRDAAQKSIEDVIRSVFFEIHSVFGHHDGSLLRAMDTLDRVVIDNHHLLTVLQCAMAMQDVTDGVFTIQGLRLRRCIRDAVRRGDGIPEDAVHARMDALMHPSSPESNAHAQFLDAVADLGPDALRWEDGEQGRVLLKRAGMPLDLDALSKGYCVDVMGAELCAKVGTSEGTSVSGVLVEWGGDVRVWGSPAARCRKHPEDDSSSGASPCWVLGIVLPPRLDTLYHHWKTTNATDRRNSDAQSAKGAGADVVIFSSSSSAQSSSAAETADETSYLRAVQLSEGEYCAMATSGDYAQVERFGFTHTVDAKHHDLLRAQGHTIASSSVVATSAMLADAIATTLMACSEISAALQLIGRASQSWRRHRTSLPLSPSAATTTLGGSMTQFYLCSRNNQVLVHDEDDLVPGEGDAHRAARYANGQRCADALHEIQAVTTASQRQTDADVPVRRPTPAAAVAAAAAARRESSKALLDSVRTMGTADAFHHTASLSYRPDDDDDDTEDRADGVSAGMGRRAPSVAYSLSAAAGNASDINAVEERKLTLLKHIGRECIPHLAALLVFPSQAVSGLGRIARSEKKGDVGSALSIARMSSVVLLTTGNRGGGSVTSSSPSRHQLSFNVMRGTPLFNAVVQASLENADKTLDADCSRSDASMPQVLHIRSYSEGGGRAQDGRMSHQPHSFFHRDPKEWLHEKETRSATVELVRADQRSSDAAAVSFAAVVQESQLSLLLTVQYVEVIGDHCVVLCEGTPLYPASQSPMTPPPPISFPLTPLVIAATHRAHGSIGFVGFGLRMCSARPLVVSVAFSYSVASQLLFPQAAGSTNRGPGDLATPRIQICLLADCADVRRWFVTGEFVYTPVPVAQLLKYTQGVWSRTSSNVAAVLDCRLIEVLASTSSSPHAHGHREEGSVHVLTASVSEVEVLAADDEPLQECFTEVRGL